MFTVGLPCQARGWDSALPLQSAWLQSLVQQPRVHIPRGTAKVLTILKALKKMFTVAFPYYLETRYGLNVRECDHCTLTPHGETDPKGTGERGAPWVDVSIPRGGGGWGARCLPGAPGQAELSRGSHRTAAGQRRAGRAGHRARAGDRHFQLHVGVCHAGAAVCQDLQFFLCVFPRTCCEDCKTVVGKQGQLGVWTRRERWKDGSLRPVMGQGVHAPLYLRLHETDV